MGKGVAAALSLPPVLRQRVQLRLLERRVKSNDCWVGESTVGRQRYTYIKVDGKNMAAHRVSYAAFVGDVPPGLVVHHRCENKPCFRPCHLELTTRERNVSLAAHLMRVPKGKAKTRLPHGNCMTEVKFWRKAKRSGSCLTWKGYITTAGYGRVKFDKKTWLAHRLAWFFFHGRRALGPLDHLCRNRACVNPHHLELVTPRQNWERGFAPSRLNSLKTKCPRGHAYSHVDKLGRRICRTCHNAWNRRRRRRATAER